MPTQRHGELNLADYAGGSVRDASVQIVSSTSAACQMTNRNFETTVSWQTDPRRKFHHAAGPAGRFFAW